MVTELGTGGKYKNLLIKCIGVLKPEILFLKHMNTLLCCTVVSFSTFGKLVLFHLNKLLQRNFTDALVQGRLFYTVVQRRLQALFLQIVKFSESFTNSYIVT